MDCVWPPYDDRYYSVFDSGRGGKMTAKELADICYECRGYGDDYYYDDNGENVSACDECWVTKELEGDD